MSVARIARLSSAVALLLVAVWLFLPTALGGSTTYVSTFGDSMEPGFTAGDLAILRPADDYASGDVVAYSAESLGTTVMHRIVDGDAATGFVLQGDNNSWLDEDRPGDDQILGRLWLRIPHGGKALEGLRSPWVLAVLGVAATVIVGLTARTPRGRGGSHRARAARTPRPVRSVPLPVRARASQIAVGAAVAAVLGGAGTAALLVLPATQTDVRTVQVTQTGQFAYAGDAVRGTTYPTGRIETGDPIYTNLIDGLTVTFDHSLSADGPTSAEGSLRLAVAVEAPDGWSAPLPEGPAVPVADGSATASVVLDPAAALDVLRRHYAEIGAVDGGATLTVTPVLDVTGTVEGRPFTAAELPGLPFTLDSTAMRPAGESGTLGVTGSSSVGIEETTARSFAVSGFTVTLGAARVVAGTVLVLGMVVLTAATWLGRAPGDPAEEFAVRHAARILRVSAFTAGSTVVDVADAEALHRVAERLDGLVLHLEDAAGSTFVVQDGDTTYRYAVPRGAFRAPAAVPVPRFA
jgi:signal peptidase I